MPPKLSLANLPTPLLHHPQLDALVGCEVWVKRDDMTGGVESGNKARKLEYLLAEAKAQGADTVITCGGFQSNHCRATAVLARSVGLHTVALLRTDDGQPLALEGNPLLAAIAGADLRSVDPVEYGDRTAAMQAVAQSLRAQGRNPYIIPEGGSNALGALAYVDAMAELRTQLNGGMAGGKPFDVVAHACGSGGTGAGVAVGSGLHGVAEQTWSFAVCDDREYFDDVTEALWAPLLQLANAGSRLDPPRPRIFDRWKGPRYAVASDAQLAFIAEVGARTGLVVDNAYTGKALYGLSQHPERPQRACFIHTGGFPGLMAAGATLLKQLPTVTRLKLP